MHPETPPRHPQLTLADLSAELLWPSLFRAARLSLRPGRLAMGLLTIVAIGLIGSLSLLWHSGPTFGDRVAEVFGEAAGFIGVWFDSLSLARPWDLHLVQLASSFDNYLAGTFFPLFRDFPVSSVILGVPMLAAALVGWAAIARSAAWEFGIAAVEPGPVVVAKAIRRLPTLMLCVLGPVAIVTIAVLLMGLIGWLFIGLPVMNIIGALFWWLALLVALVLVLVLAAWLIGFPMLAPAVMCEGPDTFDAVQRSMAYVLGRPLRYFAYVGTLIAVGAIMATIVAMLLYAADRLAGGGSAIFLARPQSSMLTRTLADSIPELTGTAAAAARIIVFWKSVLMLLLGAFVMSYISTGSAVLYLLMRKLNDGQDPGDLAAEL